MVTEPFDPKKSYISVKAHEEMLAFVSFLIETEEDTAGKEGILKISSFDKPFGGGYLTLTFIVDTGQPSIRDLLARCFGDLTEASLREHMGDELDRVNKVSLDTMTHTEGWYMEEINVYFRQLKGVEKTVVEQSLLPALEKVLPVAFRPVEWWPADKVKQAASPEEDWVDHLSTGSVKSLFRKWFGQG